ncbi:DHA2 family efflux MFS transporter permease subunit [Amycolatopsis sp. 195334CR]|uniref:DHA2 family efflux MFS transporter permease subunit n=1 Tax=Amycolatopsis sp. 195334CR TaxID=2814588 RepID=UPI001A8D49AD|nr:DHA2 family efflux MFS transporter permease subunit [Amycolatopsis sp. 195334CR]MBN6036854.1 DHA2 family efflux MFS transporter permease subunit [Amycolatopsis sp. 195334CR]
MPENGGSRWFALSVLSAATLMVVLDGSVVTVALPWIQRDLGFSQAGLAWVVNAYLIAFAGSLLLSGRLGDLLGRRRVFLAGMVVFTAASLLCGIAADRTALVVFRFLQGAGGAMASAVVLGMIVTLFPEPRAQAKAIGVYSFVQAGGSSIGLIAGGVLTQGLSWNWAFFVNLPIGVAAIALTWRLVAADRGPGLREGADLAGAGLVTGGLMLLVYTIVQAEEHSWGSARSIGLLVFSLVLLAGFVLRQAKAAKPLLPLRVFRVRAVAGANLVMVLMVAGLFGFQFITALYLQRVLELDALWTGLAFLPAPVTIAVFSLGFAARLAERFGARHVLTGGLVLVALSLAWLARVPEAGLYTVDVLPVLVMMGAGFGSAMPALMGLAMSGATASDSGIASGLINTTQQVGAAMGTAVLATAATTHSAELLSTGVAEKTALTEGFQLSYGLSAGFVALAAVTAAVFLRRSAERVHAVR